MVSNDISWPEFSNDLDAVTHAIGLTILDYVRLQTTFNRFISITGLLDSKTFSFLRRTLNNSEKSQFLKILLESIDTNVCLLYTSPSPRDRTRSRMPSSA